MSDVHILRIIPTPVCGYGTPTKEPPYCGRWAEYLVVEDDHQYLCREHADLEFGLNELDRLDGLAGEEATWMIRHRRRDGLAASLKHSLRHRGDDQA